MTPNSPLPYTSLSAFAPEVTPGTLLARLVAGLGFRLRWATEGLRREDYEFRAHADLMSIGEVLEHVGKMVSWVQVQFVRHVEGAETAPELRPDHDALERREHCLHTLRSLELQLLGFGAQDLERVVVEHPSRGQRPFWVLVNGPLSDALTHVGQINAWRRQAGNPAPKSQPFDGLPPGG